MLHLTISFFSYLLFLLSKSEFGLSHAEARSRNLHR